MSAKAAMKTVLVVDDDADLRQQMAAALGGRYEVVTAASGKECLQTVARKRPDCVVMDVMMDDLTDGLETAKKLKEDKATAAIPVILLTSVNKSYDYRSQADAGLFPHDKWLDKPVKAEKLLKEVAALIG
jgi:CheY-like chemotaxis protein